MTRPTGVGRGGRKAGGRPPGAKNKRTLLLTEVLPRLEAADQKLPLYKLLDRIEDNNLDERYRDMLCVQVLPYLHPRLRSDLTAKAFFQMSPQELDAVEKAQLEHEREIAKGRGHLRVIERG